MTVHPAFAPFFRAADPAQEDETQEGPEDSQKQELTPIGEDPGDDYDIDLDDEENGDWQHRMLRSSDEAPGEVGEDVPAPPSESGKAKKLKLARGDAQ